MLRAAACRFGVPPLTSIPCGAPVPSADMLRAAACRFGVPPLTRCFSSIPIVDVSALVQPHVDHADPKVRRTADELYHAARDVGFFYAVEHGVPATLCQDVLHHASQWFSLPAATKQEISLSADRYFRGYQGLGANVTRYEGGYTRDHHEGLDFYAESSPNRASRIHGPNQWPVHIPKFDAALREYVQHMLQVGQQLMQGITLGLLGVPGQRLPGEPKTAEESYWCMRIINYPPLPGSDNIPAAGSGQNSELDSRVQLSCGEHTDYGLLTLVNQQQDITALQVKNAAGQWIDAAPIEGAFVCNIGDMLKLMSGGLLKPTRHRVLNNSGQRTRTSCAFFYEPAYEAMVQPAEPLRKLMPDWFGSVRYGSHLENKVYSNFEM